MNWSMILEYFKVIGSWPPIVFIMFIILIKTFHDPIANWIRNLRVKYGETEFSSQVSRRNEDSKVEIETKVDQSMPADSQKVSQNNQDTALQWRSAAYLWEYRYLNLYFVLHTQQFLDWISGLKKPIAIGVADAMWTIKVPDPKERRAIVDALEQHYLITIEDNSISVTEKGLEYIKLRGYVPPAFPELDALAKAREEEQ